MYAQEDRPSRGGEEEEEEQEKRTKQKSERTKSSSSSTGDGSAHNVCVLINEIDDELMVICTVNFTFESRCLFPSLFSSNACS